MYNFPQCPSWNWPSPNRSVSLPSRVENEKWKQLLLLSLPLPRPHHHSLTGLCVQCVCLSCISRCPFVLSPTAPRRRVVCLPFPRWEKLCHKFYVNSPKIVVIVLLQLLFSLLLHFCCSFYSSTFCWLLLLLSCRDKMHLNKLFLDQCRVILLVGAFPSYVHVSLCVYVCVRVGVGVPVCALTNLITS